MTRDGVVVVTHDETLQRIYGVGDRVQECSYADLLSICSSRQFPPVATLDSVFDKFPHVPIHLDVKAHDEQLMQVVMMVLVVMMMITMIITVKMIVIVIVMLVMLVCCNRHIAFCRKCCSS